MNRTTQTGVIRSKLAPPPPPEPLVARPRLERLVADLVDQNRVVVVSATAGAGKTTALTRAIPLFRQPVAWLTVDRTDTAPGRLVTYLDAAVAEQLPHLRGVAAGALAAGIPHAEAAGILADRIGDAQLVFVFDELERLGQHSDAWRVVESFIRYSPSTMRTVLLSRHEIPTALCALPSINNVAIVGETDLAFSASEAAQALSALGLTGVDAEAAVAATGGWVTGVLFEAWRSVDHVTGLGGEADPLHGYLSAHILDQLEPADREFLVTTSLLDEVTAARAAALGAVRAGEHLAALRAAHLPVAWRPDGRAMHIHSRFREYLLERLERRGEPELQGLRAAYGRLLAREGHDEEATNELLRAGLHEEALQTAERAIPGMIERLDFAIAERWLEELAGVAPSGELTTAELMLAIAREDYRRAVRIADQLAALDERDRLAAASANASALMIWGYFHLGRIDDARAVLRVAEPGPAVQAARYALEFIGAAANGNGPVVPELTGDPLDALLLRARYFYGRLSGLADSAPSDWADAVAAPYRIAALRAAGHTRKALELYEAARASHVAAVSLAAFVGPELLIDAGRYEEAQQEIIEGRAAARASGSVFYEWFNRLAEAKLFLKLERNPAAARATLERLEHDPATRPFAHIREMLDTWAGFALLLESEDAAALARLRRAVESSLASDRLLELPHSAVYLAEAEWRAGHEEAADRAADVALEAARRQGSNHLLLQALADFPAVVARRIDAETGTDSPWHELGRALIAQGVTIDSRVGVAVELHEFGRTAIVVGGEQVRPRIAKSYELLAYLASSTTRSADRSELLDAIFDGRNDRSTRAYLRQAMRWLRYALPEGGLIADGPELRLDDELAVISESARFEELLAEAARLQGTERLKVTREALEIYDRGDYLAIGRSSWTDERRQRLAELATDARYEAGELTFNFGDYADAERLIVATLQADPFRELAWRLRMKIANAVGDEDGVMGAFQACSRALSQIGVAPSQSTRQLLDSLRR